MAKFCKYCGTPLEDGQVCSCAGAQAAPEAAAPVATATAAPSAPSSIFTDLKNDFLNYLRAPEATVRNNLDNGLKIPAIFAAVNALAAFFYCWRLIVAMFSGILDAVGAGMFGSKISYPVILLLLIGILLAVVYIGLSALGLFCVSKLSKRELSFTQGIAVASYHSVIPTLLLLVGTLLGFISLPAQLIVLPIALIIWSVFAVQGAKEYAGLNATLAGKNLAIQTLVSLIIVAIAAYLTYQLLIWGIGEVSVAGYSLKDAFDFMSSGLGGLLGGSGDITDILGSLM